MSLRKAVNIYTGASIVTPNAFMLDWYNGLIGAKPSSGLMSALNALSAGMNSDGDWTEMDFIAISAGMETEEQALRPLKTTGNAVQTNVDATGGSSPLVWSTSGYASNSNGILLSGYNPLTNGVKYSLNSAFLALYGNTRVNVMAVTRNIAGGYYSPDGVIFNASNMSFQVLATSVRNSGSFGINDDGSLSNSFKAKTSGNSNVPFCEGLKRTSSTARISFINNVNSANSASPVTGIPDIEFSSFGLNSYDPSNGGYVLQQIGDASLYQRACIFGSGSISQTNTGARLNTFFSARGLNPYV